MNEALLKSLHILTRDGKMNADSRRKLKQVHHLAQLIEPHLKNYDQKLHRGPSQDSVWRMADLGAGKSYLGFILYDLILQHLPSAHLLAIEARPELIESSKKLAREAGFERMEFIASHIEGLAASNSLPKKIDVVTTLHACDTATDDAIRFGLQHAAEIFALVPCCQAEVARQLEPLSRKSALENGQITESDRALIEFPLHRREFGSHLTNVVRVLFLKSQGYRVSVTELVGWEHSLKNELILADRISTPEHPESRLAARELESLLARFKISPKLLRETTATTPQT